MGELKNRIDFDKLRLFTRISGLDFTSSNYTLFTIDNGYINKKSHVTTKALLYHFISKKTAICLPRYPHSKIYIIDIDKRNNKRSLPDIIRDLVNLLGIPFYLEKGLSGGYHLYFQFIDYLSVDFWKWLVKHFKKEFKAEIEPIYEGKQIKVPFSVNYKLAGRYNYKTRTQIDKEVSCFDDVFQIFASAEVNPLPDIYIKNKEKLKIEITLKACRNLHGQGSIDFSYGCGTRHEKQIPLGFYILKNKGTFQDFLQACYYWNNGTSKDMNLPYGEMIKVVKNVWDYCSSRFDGRQPYKSVQTVKKPENLVMNFKYYRMRDKEQSQLREILKHYYQIYNKKYKPGGKVESRIVRECIKIIKILNEIKEYRTRYKYRYKNEEANFLKNGVPFGIELQKKVAKNFGIRNIEEKIDFLEWTGIIEVLRNEDGFSYSYKKFRYVKHFIIKAIQKIYKKIKNFTSQVKDFINETFIDTGLKESIVYKEVIGYG